ncbi:MAG: hypothetical protein HYZ67_05480 [Chlamydiae bacterium]|nr:hypothetical protein [Chlamydiota bacterium]
MSDIHEAKVKVTGFVQEELGKDPASIRVLKLAKSDMGWEGTIEVTEENEYLKKLGHPTIFDKNRYVISLDEGFNVTGFGPEEA